MDHRVPKAGLAISIACSLLAVLTFIALNEAFEGPSPIAAIDGQPYELEATFRDTEGLPTKQPVLTRGVEVGKVTGVEFNPGSSVATVRFTVRDEFGPVHEDATVAIGERTILGDPYLNLDPGTPGAAPLEAGDEVRSLPSVDFDEALAFLDADGRRHARSIIETLDEGASDPDGAAQLSGTVAELARTVRELRILTRTLRGQEDEIAGLVGDGAIVLDQLGNRERAIRSIVGSGRATLDALAARTDSLDRGLAELPPLLESARSVLARSRPLLIEARPLVRTLRRIAPRLGPALAETAPLAGEVADAVARLGTLPSLRKLLTTITLVGPVVEPMEDATRNLVTLLRYTAPRAPELGAFFANVAGVTSRGDSDGPWARFAILFEPGELSDTPTPAVCEPEDDVPVNAGFCHNAYPPPGDAADPEPYEPGSYPRLRAFTPPPPGG